MSDIVELFKQTYQGLDKNKVGDIDKLYQPDVVFIDPFREVRGLNSLKQYFFEMYQGVVECSFQFSSSILQGDSAALCWHMILVHKKLNGGRQVTVPGSSFIKFDSKIYYHHDYFDAGVLLYENIPLLGRLIKLVKEKV